MAGASCPASGGDLKGSGCLLPKVAGDTDGKADTAAKPGRLVFLEQRTPQLWHHDAFSLACNRAEYVGGPCFKVQ